MRSNVFKEAKTSVYVFSLIVILTVIFYFLASVFTAMGFKSSSKDVFVYERDFSIILDAGHGGEDPGAEANGIKEKDINLDVVFRLNEILNANGYNVTLTRNGDNMLYTADQSNNKKRYDLQNRVDIGNSSEADAFVSIHMNKYPAEYCSGFQAFYTDNNESNVVLAGCLQDNIKALQPYNKRQIKRDNDTIYLINKLEIPSVLIECVFLSNEKESSAIKNDDYRKALAISIYCGIAEYMEIIDEN